MGFDLGYFDIGKELVILEASLHALGQVAQSVHNQVKLVEIGLAGKQRLRGEHLVGKHANRPNINRS